MTSKIQAVITSEIILHSHMVFFVLVCNNSQKIQVFSKTGTFTKSCFIRATSEPQLLRSEFQMSSLPP